MWTSAAEARRAGAIDLRAAQAAAWRAWALERFGELVAAGLAVSVWHTLEGRPAVVGEDRTRDAILLETGSRAAFWSDRPETWGGGET